MAHEDYCIDPKCGVCEGTVMSQPDSRQARAEQLVREWRDAYSRGVTPIISPSQETRLTDLILDALTAEAQAAAQYTKAEDRLCLPCGHCRVNERQLSETVYGCSVCYEVKSVAQAQREADAKIADAEAAGAHDGSPSDTVSRRVAEAIRAAPLVTE